MTPYTAKPCPSCSRPMKLKEHQFNFRGEGFKGWVCEPCNALYEYDEERTIWDAGREAPQRDSARERARTFLDFVARQKNAAGFSVPWGTAKPVLSALVEALDALEAIEGCDTWTRDDMEKQAQHALGRCHVFLDEAGLK